MSSYTITFSPDDTTNATTTLRVNFGVAGPRITELTIRAGDGEGFAPEDLPGIELSRLMGAITGMRELPIIDLGPVEPVPAPARNGTRAPRKAARAARTPRAIASAKEPTVREAAKASTAREAAKPSTARTAAKASTAQEAAKAPAKRTRAAAKRARAAEPATGTGDRRAYRRTPDDFVAVFNRLGSVTQTAAHFEVPRHTAQGWVRRLRQQGDLPER